MNDESTDCAYVSFHEPDVGISASVLPSYNRNTRSLHNSGWCPATYHSRHAMTTPPPRVGPSQNENTCCHNESDSHRSDSCRHDVPPASNEFPAGSTPYGCGVITVKSSSVGRRYDPFDELFSLSAYRTRFFVMAVSTAVCRLGGCWSLRYPGR